MTGTSFNVDKMTGIRVTILILILSLSVADFKSRQHDETRISAIDGSSVSSGGDNSLDEVRMQSKANAESPEEEDERPIHEKIQEEDLLLGPDAKQQRVSVETGAAGVIEGPHPRRVLSRQISASPQEEEQQEEEVRHAR